MNGNHKPVGRPVGRPFQAVAADGLERPSYEEIREARLTAYALGQLDGEEKAVVEAELAGSPAARREIADIQAVADQLREANRAMVVPASETLRAVVEMRFNRAPALHVEPRSEVLKAPPLPGTGARRNWRAWAALAAAACLLAAAAGLYLGRRDRGTDPNANQVAIGNTPALEQLPGSMQPATSEVSETSEVSGAGSKKASSEQVPAEASRLAADSLPPVVEENSGGWRPHVPAPPADSADHARHPSPESPSRLASDDAVPRPEKAESKKNGAPGPPAKVDKSAGPRRVYARTLPRGMRHLPAADPGFLGPGIPTGPVYMSTSRPEVVAPPPTEKPRQARDAEMGKFGAGVGSPGPGEASSDGEGTGVARPESVPNKSRPGKTHLGIPPGMRPDPGASSEESNTGRDSVRPGKKAKTPVPAEIDVLDEPPPGVVLENAFLSAAKFPYSAFCLEVNPRAYPLVDRYLRAGHLPRADQVEIEGLLNHFGYDDPRPRGDVPFAVRVEAADCPWARDHRLVRIAIVGRDSQATGAEQGAPGHDASPQPIANHARVQLQFMPALVASYRLIGYDGPPGDGKRTEGSLATGMSFPAGQTITALYELVPAKHSKPTVMDARPAKTKRTPDRDVTAVEAASPTLVVRLRYQRPGADTYWLLGVPWTDPGQSFDGASRDFRFAAAVAAFGMALQGSQYRGDINLETIERIAESARGADRQRAEFVDLVRLARQLGAGR